MDTKNSKILKLPYGISNFERIGSNKDNKAILLPTWNVFFSDEINNYQCFP